MLFMLGLRPSHNPSLTEERKKRDESIKVVISDVINNRKTGVAMLLRGIYTSYHVCPMRRPAGRLYNKSLSVT